MEERGADALAQVKFFTPDSDWTWYASEFDGEDIFFGLISGFEVEYGCFSLKELQETRGPLGLLIERDLHFEPKSLGELEEWHRKQREDLPGLCIFFLDRQTLLWDKVCKLLAYS